MVPSRACQYRFVTTSALDHARQAFADRHPQSRLLHETARTVLPGGHTRTVLTHLPFPLTFVRGEGAVLTDADDQQYIDLLGDYTAGLLGHSERRARDAAMAALDVNMSVGGIHPAEQQLARLMCERFDLELVRFTNSGSEANLMAMTAARMYTGRTKIMVMYGGYHGGLMYFGAGPAAWNVPFPIVVGRFNDLDGCKALIAEHGSDLAAVLVEPLLGSAGCVPAVPAFLRGLADAARAVGAVAIMDEVMSSRLGPKGLSVQCGVESDLKTYGKYIAGGFSFGAFGGTADVMGIFDSTHAAHVPHAGTFNNNITSMAAGTEVLTNVYTAEVATAFTERGDELRENIAQVLARYPLALCVSGSGTMMAIHARAQRPTDGESAADKNPALQEMLFLGLLRRGIYIAPRGMINLSLPVTDDQLAAFIDALADLCQELAAS